MAELLHAAGFGGYVGYGRIIYHPENPNRVIPLMSPKGLLRLENTYARSLRALWPILPRLRGLSCLDLYYPSCDEDTDGVLAECIDSYVPQSLQLSRRGLSFGDTDVFKYLIRVPELLLSELDYRDIYALADTILSSKGLTPSILIAGSTLTAGCIEILSECIASGRLHGLRLFNCGWALGEIFTSYVPIAKALGDPRCILRSLTLDNDCGFATHATVVPPSLKVIELHRTARFEVKRVARFIRGLHEPLGITLQGPLEDTSETLDAIRMHADTLKRLHLNIDHSLDVMALCTEIMRRDTNVLTKLCIFTTSGDIYEVDGFIAALQSHTCHLRSLQIVGGGTICGLDVGILSKTLLRDISYWDLGEIKFELKREWFRVMEALLSISHVPRISQGSMARIMPMSDFVPRMATILGWPLERAQ